LQLQDNSRRENKSTYFENLLALSYEFLETLQSKDSKIDGLGKILHEAWLLKKRTNKSSTNPYIDQLYETLRKKGVTGGKILGAGGGGFFLAFAKDPDVKDKIKYTLYPNFITLDVKFSKKGTEVLWKNF
jgi:D-glycero-alpha-D-manno-heptose-7-phosphate kinase